MKEGHFQILNRCPLKRTRGVIMNGIKKVTYIEHSSFLVETDTKYLLFDYCQGILPKLDQKKPLYVFASHAHGDHFASVIFTFARMYPQIQYVLSYDIKLKPGNIAKWNIQEELSDKILTVKANEHYETDDIMLDTLKSTDAGVAFLVKTDGKLIYHAGDLNWWYWEGESKQCNNNMTADFKREVNKMKGLSIDIAFVPLDPRQEAYYYLGMEYLLKTANVKYVFPMHMWKDYSVISKFKKKKSDILSEKGTILIDIQKQEQEFGCID